MNDLVKSVLTFITAWMLIIGCFWFLWVIVKSLADPEQAAIPEATLGMIVGGLVVVLSRAGEFVFQSESSRSTARAIGSAAANAAKTALTPPPSTALPVELVETEEPPSPNG